MPDLTDREVLLRLVDEVNNTETLPATAKLDNLGADAPAASVQTLPGARWATRYISGGGVRELPFALLLRVSGRDTATRADAAAALSACFDALEALDLPEPIVSITGTDTPALVERNDTDGSEVFRVSGVLESVRGAQ